jgi:hypothetical protein
VTDAPAETGDQRRQRNADSFGVQDVIGIVVVVPLSVDCSPLAAVWETIREYAAIDALADVWRNVPGVRLISAIEAVFRAIKSARAVSAPRSKNWVAHKRTSASNSLR